MRRLADRNDIAAIYAIYMHAEVVPFLGFEPMALSDFALVFERLLESQCFYVVEVNGDVQAFYKAARYEGRAAHVACLGTLAVSPAAKGNGLARAMVEEAIADLQQQGVARVELMVEADNPRAIDFYRKLGFQYEGTMRSAYKRSKDAMYVDELLFARLLVPTDTKREVQPG